MPRFPFACTKSFFYSRMNRLTQFIITSMLALTGCGSNSSDPAPTPPPPPSCSVTQLETDMSNTLSQLNTSVDFSLILERNDNRRYVFNKGNANLQTVYESASTSKLVTAVIILRLVEQGYLSLDDYPQQWIPDWPITSENTLYTMNLAQLLSFTSGLESEPFCLHSGISDFSTCVTKIAEINASNAIEPGTRFYYAGTHLQVAGLMAIKARGVRNWQDIFSEFKLSTGLFTYATYDLPSATNPRLAGGMHWSSTEYIDFLNAIKAGTVLNAASMTLLLSDHTAAATIAYSPAQTSLGEDWHYGFGLWHECQSAVFNCDAGSRVSSPGAYGAYPFWDRSNNYIGLVARQGELASGFEGVNIERAMRTKTEQWAACD